MTSIALLIITDGQPKCLDAAAKSISLMWRGQEPDTVTIIDDSGDPAHQAWVDKRFARWSARIIHHPIRLGFAAAIATGWAAVAGADFVFHAEHDFVYDRPVPVPDMMRLLDWRPYLAQVSLMRQPVNDAEVVAGGVVASRPGEFTDLHDGDLRWMEQRSYFTTNPSLYRGSLCDEGWPQVPQSEGRFSHHLLEHGFGNIAGPEVRFGVLGSSADPPAVTHIGQRQGTGY